MVATPSTNTFRTPTRLISMISSFLAMKLATLSLLMWRELLSLLLYVQTYKDNGVQLEPLIKFIRIDCSNNIRLCEDEYNITHFPSYRFITPQIYHSRKATLTKATPFAFIDFIDQKLGMLFTLKREKSLDLHRTLGGGLDPQFGREPAIDEQIDAFIEVQKRKEMVDCVGR